MTFVSNNKGFTLLELLIAAYILVVGIGSMLLLSVNAMTSSRLAWDMTMATSHAEHILEDMQAKDTLADVVQTDWIAWAAQQQLNTLPEEKIVVNFNDATADPLDIEVTVYWQRQSKNSSISLRTRLTK